MNNVKQTEYRTYWTSMIHAMGCFILSTIAMWYICGDGKTVFNNDECMNTPRYIHVWALLHTCGYFTQDACWLFFVSGGHTALDYQTYAHHIVATVTFYQTLYYMDFMIVFGVMLLFIEVSSIFLSLRFILFAHGYGETKLYGINALVAFVAFLLGRVFFQTYIIVWVGFDWIARAYMKKDLTVFKAVVVAELMTMVILSLVLNAYWFMLMTKMIIRVINRALAKKKDTDEEKLELVKADSLALGN